MRLDLGGWGGDKPRVAPPNPPPCYAMNREVPGDYQMSLPLCVMWADSIWTKSAASLPFRGNTAESQACKSCVYAEAGRGWLVKRQARTLYVSLCDWMGGFDALGRFNDSLSANKGGYRVKGILSVLCEPAACQQSGTKITWTGQKNSLTENNKMKSCTRKARYSTLLVRN